MVTGGAPFAGIDEVEDGSGGIGGLRGRYVIIVGGLCGGVKSAVEAE